MQNICFLFLLMTFCALSAQESAEECFNATEEYAIELDMNDPLKHMRDEFFIPTDQSGKELIYFCGHSLGLEPKMTRAVMSEELDAWARLGVEGHSKEKDPWYSYHTLVRDPLSRVVGAQPHEVVAMNSLTANLHLMMVSFYRPTPSRYKILMEAPVFSSDTYAVKSQIRHHGYSPDEALIVATPRDGEECLRMEDVEALIEEKGDEIALVLFSGVNYFSGQCIDMERIVRKAHERGFLVGFDLAHAIGNVALQLHDWNVDFAAWCSYKYLNAGPGAIGGVFVHENHCRNTSLDRFSGWWGNDPETRFQLHLQPEFIPVPTADSWQLSNPSIFALVPLKTSLQLFDRVGMNALKEKSRLLTGYLEFLIDDIGSDRIEIITPRNPKERGCQLSIMVHDRPQQLMDRLKDHGVICDFRRPNVIRITPIPMYNGYHEVWKFAHILRSHLDEGI